MKRWAVTVLLAAGIAAAVLLAIAAALLRDGLSARPEPSAFEAAVARRVRHLAVPAAARSLENPVTTSDAVLAEGRAHFADHCASCHGNDGRGRTSLGRALYPRAPDMTASGTQGLSDGELFYAIENGVRFTGMPGFGGGRPEESWKLVAFIRHLPRLTEGELREMEQLNPRSAQELREEQDEDAFLRGDGAAPPAPAAHHH